MQLGRAAHVNAVGKRLRGFPVVAIVGPRQVGKTTLAALVALQGRYKQITRFDLESPVDLARLADPMGALESRRGLVILDEIQRLPEVFPVLRVLADRARTPARFLVLGSAGPELLRQSSESLAGRIAYYELPGLDLSEVGESSLSRLWLRGGFPRAYLAPTNADSMEWREQFIRTFVERDLPQLGIRLAATAVRRFWTMLAHYHGQVWNASELGRALGADYKTAQHYLDTLMSTFMVRRLQPYFANIKKRQVKAPKIYLTDSGLLHTLLDLPSRRQLEGHPKIGASWEGFLIEQLCIRLRVQPANAYFWGTHSGPELDLVVHRGGQLHGFEIKRTVSPRATPSMRKAKEILELASLTLIHAGAETFEIGDGIRAVAARRLLLDL